MNSIKFNSLALGVGSILLLTMAPVQSLAQGMPPEARKNIHALFSNHDGISRSVEWTDAGYIAITESDNPEIRRVLKAHISQMTKRLQSGRAVRRWDPAFAEFVQYYDQMEHKLTATEKGVRMEVVGKTPAAVKVAQNHAKVILDFVEHGWAGHDRSHAAVGASGLEQTTTKQCCAGSGNEIGEKGCCPAQSASCRQLKREANDEN